MRISDWSSDVCSSDLEKATPRRGMFDGLKLSAAPLKGAERAPMPADRGQGRDYARAVERASRSAEAVLQARASGAPVLEHQRQALQRATQALEQIRPGEIGREHVRTPVTHEQLVCRPLHEKENNNQPTQHNIHIST